ncbi:MAG: purine-nucleoside phosphorylase [Saprospiraceae bacterium]|nr:purine-nucleoside phosphorylase [Saprospiraceae bacterium]
MFIISPFIIHHLQNALRPNTKAAAFFAKQNRLQPRFGIILGTGLSGLANEIEVVESIDYQAIPHFSASTVRGHAGKLIFGKLAGANIVAMAGRFHFYEGYTMQQVTFPVRVMRALGVDTLMVSNAAGSVNGDMEAGDLVFIRDHINLHPDNPLRGPNDERLGVRFPDMLHAYDLGMLALASNIAQANNIRAHQGVYVALPGPNLETPAEYEFMHRIGADVVGMSTVPEVLVARHAGMRVFAVSVVSNKSYPISAIQETSHDEILAAVGKASARLTKVVMKMLGELKIEN